MRTQPRSSSPTRSIRDSVYEGLALIRRVALHDTPRSTSRMARVTIVGPRSRRTGCDPVATRRAAHASVLAAQQSRQRLAFMDAAAHLGRAVTSLVEAGADESEVIDVMLDQAEMTLRAGQPTTARELFLDVAARARRQGQQRRVGTCRVGLGAGSPVSRSHRATSNRSRCWKKPWPARHPIHRCCARLLLARLAVASFFVTPRRHDPLGLATEALRHRA